MSEFSTRDRELMNEAIQLGWKGLYSTDPNPRVGCVLARNDQVIGRGFHQRAGEGHAEVNALREAGDARGATAYVTLEPCSHFGKTPPCAQALINAGVSRVVAAMTDPNPQVAGRGLAMLKEAGIAVASGLLESQARALNPGFLSRMERGRPFTRLKIAVSVDGRTAMRSGESKWITGADARADVQALRARSSAIMSGIGSILHDDSALTVRNDELRVDLGPRRADHQPLRVILDPALKIPLNARVLKQPGNTCVVTEETQSARLKQLSQAGVKCWHEALNSSGAFDLPALLERLAREESVNELLVETGADLAGRFLKAGLIDELWVYMAPKLMGSDARPLALLPFEQMSEAIDLELKDLRQLGKDLRMIWTPVRSN